MLTKNLKKKTLDWVFFTFVCKDEGVDFMGNLTEEGSADIVYTL